MKRLRPIFRWIVKHVASAKRIDLDVPFAQKDEAKRLGAKWDPRGRVWYITDKFDIDPFLQWLPGARSGNRLYLDVPFADKDVAREMGAEWDPIIRSWFVPPDVQPAPFVRWEKKLDSVFDISGHPLER